MGRGRVSGATVDALQPVALDDPASAAEEIFAEVSRDRTRAAGKLKSYLAAGGDPRQIINTARRLVFLKGRDAHDYKFSSAVLEDFYHVSPRFRDYCLAASVFKLHGADEQDNGLVERIRTVLS